VVRIGRARRSRVAEDFLQTLRDDFGMQRNRREMVARYALQFDILAHRLPAKVGIAGGALQNLELPGELFTAPAVSRDASEKTSVYLGFLPATRYRVRTCDRRRLAQPTRAPLDLRGARNVARRQRPVFIEASGALSALDARTGKRLWSPRDASAGGTIRGIHWQSPIAVNGYVYCSDEGKHLTAYALGRR